MLSELVGQRSGDSAVALMTMGYLGVLLKKVSSHDVEYDARTGVVLITIRTRVLPHWEEGQTVRQGV
jgi:hypothetical protein